MIYCFRQKHREENYTENEEHKSKNKKKNINEEQKNKITFEWFLGKKKQKKKNELRTTYNINTNTQYTFIYTQCSLGGIFLNDVIFGHEAKKKKWIYLF